MATYRERQKELKKEINHRFKNLLDTDHGCAICGDPIVYGDERNMWIGYHQSWYHRVYRAIIRFFLV